MRRLGGALGCLLLAACSSFEDGGAAASGADAGGASASSSSGGSSSGGSSSGGPSGPEILAAGLSNVRAVTPTSGGVYWLSVELASASSQLEVHRCELSGCAGASARIVHEAALQLGHGGSDVYWAAPDGAIRACSVGATCAPREVMTEIDALAHVLGDRGALLYTSNTGAGGRIHRCAPDACSSTTETVWSGAMMGVLALAGDHVYFTAGVPSTKLLRVSTAGGQATDLGTLPGLPTAIAALPPRAYFVSQGSLYRCDTSMGCTPALFDAKETSIAGLAVHDGSVYYSVQAAGGTPGKIHRCPADDCASPEVVVEGGNPHELAVHEGFVYYADWGDTKSGSGSVRRVRL